jgi:hypothetical protein
MTVKKKYNIGDTVWIYGISKNNIKSTEGKIVQTFVIKQEGWSQNVHYVIAVPTEIEYLLEVRTWETISQTKDGHVGSLRDAFTNPDAAHKMLARTGIKFISDAGEDYTGDGHDGMGSTLEEFDRYEEHLAEEDDISPDAIHAALEKSQQGASHSTLIPKENKPKRRNFTRKKKV